MTKECPKKIAREICRKKWGKDWYKTEKKQRLRFARCLHGSVPKVQKAAICTTANAEPAWPMTTLLHYVEQVHGLPSGHLVVNNETIYHAPENQQRFDTPLPALATSLRENCCRFHSRQVHIIQETWNAMSLQDRERVLYLKCPSCQKQVETVYTCARIPGDTEPM